MTILMDGCGEFHVPTENERADRLAARGLRDALEAAGVPMPPVPQQRRRTRWRRPAAQGSPTTEGEKMSPMPTGRLVGTDLALIRTFRASVADVWASITDPARTAGWFGPWHGDAAPGSTIKVQMAYEEGQPWMDCTIDRCEPPYRLAISALDEHGGWHLEMTLVESAGVTELRFTQHLNGTDGVGEVGPGWEYYLDALVASRAGEPAPNFGDYYPAMKEYFEAQR
ncbi:SRPBCC family protein [Micromonospora sp. LOL_023]|uniref:SRPBCC family protein n=1 Tax=Micromonospora sp. LOL_023 TaxID=3345418 RepID=UPI003A861406